MSERDADPAESADAGWWRQVPAPIRKAMIATAGTVLLIAGALMLVLPGPGIVVLLLGLLVLATEFAWARRLHGHVSENGLRMWGSIRDRFRRH